MNAFRLANRGSQSKRFVVVTHAASALFTSCALVAGGVLAGWAAPVAIGNPATAAGWPSPACDGKSTKPMDLWDDVKDATPQKPGNNEKVVFPGGANDREHGYAIHFGAEPKQSATNHLLLAAIREQGIECPNLLDSAAAEYFHDAFTEKGVLPKGTDWALGIESADNRSRDQLHIHISKLKGGARTDIDNAAKSIPTKESDWRNAIITVQGKKFRAWHAPDLDHNLFILLNDQIVTPLQGKKVKVGMADETLLVTASTKGSGVVVLSSDEVSPDTKPAGANNIEFLLDKG